MSTNSKIGRQTLKNDNPAIKTIDSILQMQRLFANKARKYPLRNSREYNDAVQDLLEELKRQAPVIKEIKDLLKHRNFDQFAGDSKKILLLCREL
jgi:hypothetical protein